MNLLFFLGLLFLVVPIPLAYADYIPIRSTWAEAPIVCLGNYLPGFEDIISKYNYIKSIKSWEVALEKYTETDNFDYRIILPKTQEQIDLCSIQVFFVHTIIDEEGKDENTAGFAECESDGTRTQSCIITINTRLAGHIHYPTTFQHEFGHTLGLGHRVPNEGENMAGVLITNDIMIYLNSEFRYITNEDLDALISAYGKSGWDGHNLSHYNYKIK